MSGRFVKGQSGNPNGRPRARRPNVSAFDIIFDKTLTVTQAGVERELSVDEALQHQTYQAALKGSKMAVRTVLKMIEKREVALRKSSPAPTAKVNRLGVEYDSDNANEAMLLLGIVAQEPPSIAWPQDKDPRLKIETWAAQAAISCPGRKRLSDKDISDAKFMIHDPDKLRWPRGSAQ